MRKSIIRGSLLLVALITIATAISCTALPTIPGPPKPTSEPFLVPQPISNPVQPPTPKDLERPLILPKALLPEKVIFDGTGLKFNSGKWELEPQNLKMLQDVVTKARSSGTIFIVLVSGYSSSTGSRARSITFSRRRANFVAKTLAAAGIQPEKITVKSYGPDNPIADNATWEGRQKNQRVEIEFLNQ